MGRAGGQIRVEWPECSLLVVEAHMGYKKKAVSPDLVRNLVASIQRKIGARVLVFGASNVTLIEELLKTEREITLIDIRPEAFEKFAPFGSRVRLVLVKEHAEFEELSGRFDTILFYDTLHHVADKQTKISECRRVMDANGVIVIYEPNISSKFLREYDQFGVLKDSMYKWNLIRLLKRNDFRVTLLSAEQLVPTQRPMKRFVQFMQKTVVDPNYRILMLAEKS
jgi:2-polyprenyl-3-methyl-5-hydroxy-6-metoxy-1,4-benzoquinol methylase